jgi:lantibiotic biosynthesis protein
MDVPTMRAPLLDGELAAAARRIIDDIVAALRARPLADDAMACDLMRGELGGAILLAYHARLHGDEMAVARVGEMLERAIELVPMVSDHPDLFAGFVGTAWAFEHLGRVIEVDDDLNEGIDEALLELVEARPERLSYELLLGTSGLAVYALERYPRGGGLLAALVDHLAELAEPCTDGIRWRCPEWMPLASDRARFPDGCFPLDPAHGAMGPIVVLAGAVALGVSVDRARSLLDGSVRWLAAQRLAGDGALFPRNAGEAVGGLAWCGGDPGIAACLSATALAVGESSWHELAIAAARRVERALLCGSRVDPDGGLCHGPAGLAHLLHRVARTEPSLEPAAQLAFRQLAAVGTPSGEDTSLLTGSAGIGLALLAATTSADPAWDRALLLSLRGSRDH